MHDSCFRKMENKATPYVADINCLAMNNRNFRTVIWTGCHLQMTLMCIPVCEDIGAEIHTDTDQFIRIEHGNATLMTGCCKCRMDSQQSLCEGDGVFIPAGTWHNIINTGNEPLKVSSIYAPPNHPWNTMQRTKCDAEYDDH